MAKRRGKVDRAAEDLLASLLTFSSGVFRNQAKVAAKNATAYKAPKYVRGTVTSGESGGSSGGNGDNAVGKVIGGFMSKLIAMLGPAALLATILSSEASGVKTFLGAVKILGNTLGSVLLPVTMLGSAAILTLSDVINSTLLPNLEDWYTMLLQGGVELIDILISAANTFSESLGKTKNIQTEAATMYLTAAKMFHEIIAGISSIGSKASQSVGNVGSMFGGVLSDGSGAIMGNPVEKFFDKTKKAALMHRDGQQPVLDFAKGQLENDPRKGTPALERLKKLLDSHTIGSTGKTMSQGGIGAAFRDNLKLSIAQFRHDNSPASREMGIAEAAKNAQMAALQMSPFEQKMNDHMVKVIDALEKAGDKLTPGAVK